MDVSARDINDQEFLLAWRGYNQDEVDDFLDQIAETMDRLERENGALRARVEELDATARSARATEEMLKKTLTNAQETAEETITEARAKAEQLMAEAEERVRRADEDVRRRLAVAEEDATRNTEELQSRFEARKHELESSLERLETFEAEIKHRLRSFMEQQLQALETLHEKQQRADVPATPAGAEAPPAREPTPSAPPDASTSSAEAEATQEPTVVVDDEDQGLVEEMAGPGEDDASLFAELAADQQEDEDEAPLDDFKPFDDEAALRGRRRRGLFRRRVDDWA